MKVEKFLNRNLTTMTIEINITKCEKVSFLSTNKGSDE